METQLPGDRIRALRKKAGFTVREIAVECDPPIDFSSVARIENNKGYTSSTLMRLATAIGCDILDFFLPDGLDGYTELSPEQKEQVHELIARLREFDTHSSDEKATV